MTAAIETRPGWALHLGTAGQARSTASGRQRTGWFVASAARPTARRGWQGQADGSTRFAREQRPADRVGSLREIGVRWGCRWGPRCRDFVVSTSRGVMGDLADAILPPEAMRRPWRCEYGVSGSPRRPSFAATGVVHLRRHPTPRARCSAGPLPRAESSTTALRQSNANGPYTRQP